MMKLKRHSPSLALILFNALAFTMSAPVTAAPNGPTFTVNTTFDGTSPGACANNVPSGCSLREAIIEANHFPGGNATINIPSGTYTIKIPPVGPDDETTGDFNLNANMTIIGAGAASTVIDANQIDRAISIYYPAIVTISGMTIRNGNGGGIFNDSTLTLNNCIVSNNGSGDGGGIFGSRRLVINNSTISNNRATGNGGGIWYQGNLTLNNSTVSNNSSAGFGGGILIDGDTTTLFNSTISNNSSTRDGGGIEIGNSGATLNVFFSTIAGNLADSNGTNTYHGGGIANLGSLGVNVKDSLLGENYAGGNPDDCSGTLNIQGYDILEYQPATCNLVFSGTGRLALPILVDSLKDNSGRTATRALLPNSPAINLIPAGTDGCGSTVNVDQRGSPRPGGSGCDVGAFEGSLPNTLYGVNLIRNNDAEGSAGSPSGATVGMPYWTSGVTPVPYGTSGFPSLTDPGPAARGVNFFAGGFASNQISSQVQSVQALSSDIDAGRVSYTLAGYFGGYADQDDYAFMDADFFSTANGSGTPIGSAGAIGSVKAADRNNHTGLLPRSTSGRLPVGTRSIRIKLAAVRVSGSYNDGYADNLSLVLTPPAFSQSDCLFNWAEINYPGLFAPAGAMSNTLAPYYYRYYPQTNAYLGSSSADNHVYYLGPLSNNSLLDVGTLSSWSSTAGCQ